MTVNDLWRRTAMKRDGHSWNYQRVKAWFNAGVCSANQVIEYGKIGFILQSEIKEIVGQ